MLFLLFNYFNMIDCSLFHINTTHKLKLFEYGIQKHNKSSNVIHDRIKEFWIILVKSIPLII